MIKAGPKKKRAKSESEQIHDAVVALGKGTRKVRSTHYKRNPQLYGPKKLRRKLSLDPTAVGMNDRNRRVWQPWEEAILFVEPTKVLDVLTKQQMACEHKMLKAERPVAVLTDIREYRLCPDCQAFLRWWGSYTATIQGEWQSLRITGYGMEEWGELFTKDKSLWVFLIEEAHAALSDEEVQNEDQ